jgi:curved DNA-binding protein CbpA
MTEPFDDLYDRLGVDRTATPAEIHRAYRDRARRAHPDVADLASPSDMALINEAWTVLRDPARRAAYDRATMPFEDEGWVRDEMLSRSTQRLLRSVLLASILLLMVLMVVVFLVGFGRVGA